MNRGPVYFAHPVNVYNTALEAAVIRLLGRSFAQIENPNQEHHQKGYKAWQARGTKDRDNHQGMNYFFDEVLPQCNGCVAMPFLDGRFGLGVVGEAKWFLEREAPLWVIGPTTTNTTSEDLARFTENPQCGVFSLRGITAMEKIAFLNNDPRFVVPHQETRLYTWVVYNNQVRSYETAHLVSMPIPPGFYPEDTKQ